ncbi:hypothetical protein, partial [Microseira wollei]|uniref:Uncharacterized protein n=1 Tax=Microseira wollei NIES-4236 TaxID=2530354 RepID=A0AAV3XIF5_9CYAN
MENQNHESKFEGTPEIESLNIADLELLYKKLEDEDAELYNGGMFNKEFECPCNCLLEPLEPGGCAVNYPEYKF